MGEKKERKLPNITQRWLYISRLVQLSVSGGGKIKMHYVWLHQSTNKGTATCGCVPVAPPSGTATHRPTHGETTPGEARKGREGDMSEVGGGVERRGTCALPSPQSPKPTLTTTRLNANNRTSLFLGIDGLISTQSHFSWIEMWQRRTRGHSHIVCSRRVKSGACVMPKGALNSNR